MKYIEIIKANRELEAEMKSEIINALLVSNITINKSKDIIEYYHRNLGVNLNAEISSYDNIVQESFGFDKYNFVIIFWEMQNFFDGLYQRTLFSNNDEVNDIIDNIKSQISTVLNNAQYVPLVLFNEFSAKPFTCGDIDENSTTLLAIADELNLFIKSFNYKNIVRIKIDDIYCKLSLGKCISYRDFSLTKSLYTVDFFKEYSSYVIAHSRHMLGKGKKCIVFDCDNTLWDGVIGEDGLNGINISKTSPKGSVFREVQMLVKYLSKCGVMIGICTKNNKIDIENAFLNHKDMQIGIEDFVSVKSNWKSKVENLQNISYELNIGLDSIVFVDDSDYEINLIKDQLPNVLTFQVPSNIYDYPKVVRNLFPLFDLKNSTTEDASRVVKYKEELERKETRSNFSNINDYIDSLEIIVDIVFDCAEDSSRLSQLTQKTNQFNITTRRYSISEIDLFIKSEKYRVVSIRVRDKYGDYGLTGLVIFNTEDPKTMKVDVFLLSCRVLGRHVERAVTNYLIEYSMMHNIKEIKFEFIASEKNKPAEIFLNESKNISKISNFLYVAKCNQQSLIESKNIMVRE